MPDKFLVHPSGYVMAVIAVFLLFHLKVISRDLQTSPRDLQTFQKIPRDPPEMPRDSQRFLEIPKEREEEKT
jgi:hypothetical protein